jgi:hypothetical protein
VAKSEKVSECYIVVSEYNGIEGPVMVHIPNEGAGYSAQPLITTQADNLKALNMLALQAMADDPGRKMKLIRLSQVEVLAEMG